MDARALERVGDRWSLLVIRDLLTGAKRFTDLMDRLGGITPKTLSQRLRELEDAGIVAADREPDRREVWYCLIPAGADLGPVLDALSRCGYSMPGAGPGPASPLHAEHLLRSVTQAIDLAVGDHEPARWHFRLDSADYLIESDGRPWSLGAGAPPRGATTSGRMAARSGLAGKGENFSFRGCIRGPMGHPPGQRRVPPYAAHRRFARRLSIPSGRQRPGDLTPCHF